MTTVTALLFLVMFLAAGALACIWVAAILDESMDHAQELAHYMREEWKK